mgnify:CR=1 FL=1
MQTRPLYRVIQLHPLRTLRRYSCTMVEDHEVFACQWLWLARLFAHCFGVSVEYSHTLRGELELGKELEQEFNDVYGVKRPGDAWWKDHINE